MEEDFDIELKVKQEPGKTQNTPIVPKEEEMDEEEFDRMMEERYRHHPALVRYAEDSQALDRDAILLSKKDPTIWKVKCMVLLYEYLLFRRLLFLFLLSFFWPFALTWKFFLVGWKGEAVSFLRHAKVH